MNLVFDELYFYKTFFLMIAALFIGCSYHQYEGFPIFGQYGILMMLFGTVFIFSLKDKREINPSKMADLIFNIASQLGAKK